MTEKEDKYSFHKEGVTLVNIILKLICLIEGNPTDYFPANCLVKDECGEMTEQNQCDYDKVKHKDLQYILNSIFIFKISISRVNTSTLF